jgi:UDP-N-acetylglucosamine acyltransferase
MIAGCSKVTKDIPPYTTADGNPARIVGLNTVGLRRAGFSPEARKAIKKTYQTIYHSDLNISQALAVLEGNIYSEEEERITAFFLNSERGVTAHR